MVSARLDDELAADAATVLDEHLAECAACTAHERDGYALRRSLRVRPVQPEATTSSVPLPAALEASSPGRGLEALRLALFVIGGTLVIINFVSIVAPESGPAAHLSRHDGVFGTALGVGMLAVAATPHRAIGLVPITSAIAVLMTVAAAADLLDGETRLLSEASHLLEFAGLLCLWVISGGPARLPGHLDRLRRLVRLDRTGGRSEHRSPEAARTVRP